MNDPIPTDSELREAFQRRGFVRLPGFLDGEVLDEVRARCERFVRDVAPTLPAHEVYLEDPGVEASLKQLQQLGRHDPWFAGLQVGSRFEQLARVLLGGEASARNLQFFDKPPGHATPTPPHQDGAYFPIRPNHAVTIWLALDDADEEQGCLRYGAGTHLRGLRDHGSSGTLGFSRSIDGYGDAADRAAEVAVPVRAGDVLAHHSLTVHRADANRCAGRRRRALGFVYYDARCVVDEDADRTYQRVLAERLRVEGRLG